MLHTLPIKTKALFVIVAVFGTLALQCSSAKAFSYSPNVVECNSSTHRVIAHATRDMTSYYGGNEEVRWTTILYRYGSNGWYVYDDTTEPWLKAAANGNGLLSMTLIGGITYTWVSTLTNNMLSTNTYGWQYTLPSGYYAVRELFKWQNGAQTSLWANTYNGLSASFCQVA
jgi:hypothetical protein